MLDYDVTLLGGDSVSEYCIDSVDSFAFFFLLTWTACDARRLPIFELNSLFGGPLQTSSCRNETYEYISSVYLSYCFRLQRNIIWFNLYSKTKRVKKKYKQIYPCELGCPPSRPSSVVIGHWDEAFLHGPQTPLIAFKWSKWTSRRALQIVWPRN